MEASPLETSIRGAFERSVGPYWTKLCKVVPPSPWKAEYMLELLITHWNAVFAHQFPKVLLACSQTCLDVLKTSSSDDDHPLPQTTVKIFLTNFAEILFFFGLEASKRLQKLLVDFK